MAATVRPLTGKSRRAFQLARGPINIWEGSVRSAKTVGSILRWIEFVRDAPAGNLLLTGKTERTVRRNIIAPMQDMLGTSRCKLNAGDGVLTLCGREIYMVGANDARAEDKIRGLTLAGAYVDEASTLPEPFWQMLTTRFSVAGAQLFATTNPEGPRHWLKLNWLDRANLWVKGDGTVSVREVPAEATDDPRQPIRLHRFSFRLTDNPYLPPDYLDRMMRQYTGLWYKRFILGEWVAADGVIYDSFDDTRHVVDELPPILRWIGVGIDYGTSSVFAALLLGVGADNRLYVCGEWTYDATVTRRTKTDAEFSQGLTAWLDSFPIPQSDPPVYGVRPRWVAVDPSASSMVTQLYRDGRYTPTIADNSVLDGIRQVAMLFSLDRLRIHRSCVTLLEELPGYVWDVKATEAGEDKPLKEGDHRCDALRYIVRTTEAEWRPVLNKPIREDFGAPTLRHWRDR